MNIKTLHQHFLQCHSACTDTRKIEKNAMFFALKGDNFNGNEFAQQALKMGAKFVIVDDEKYDISSQTILVHNTLSTLQELASHHRNYLKIPIIALTGSNGKTTTKELINIALSQKYKTTATAGNLNNHIGVPLTLLSMNKYTQIGIVEMGANHVREIDLLCRIAQPDFGYITNFGKAHLEGFGNIEGVIQGKSELYKYLITNKKTIFVNSDDPIQVKKAHTGKAFKFGSNSQSTDVIVTFKEAQPFVKVLYKDLEIQSQLLGKYNFNNIAAAIAIAHYFKVNAEAIKVAIEGYIPDNNRSQIIDKGTNKIILDAYNANPTSMKAALENFHQQTATTKIAILGDMFELGKDAKTEHQAIADLAASLDIAQVVLIGENFNRTKTQVSNMHLYKTFEDFKRNYNTFHFNNAMLLIKGSRGMALERVLELMK